MRKIGCFILALLMMLPAQETTVFAQQPVLTLPLPKLAGLKVYPKEPFRMDFLIESPANNSIVDQDQIHLFLRYFLTGLTLSPDNLWVNLSPLEADRIISDAFAQTEMGQHLLQQDYELKQLTTKLLSPEEASGHKLWEQIYSEIEATGLSQQDLSLFHKVWVVPKRAKVAVHDQQVYIQDSQLAIQLQQDDSLTTHFGEEINMTDQTKVFYNIIAPQIEQAINESETFKPLRDAYRALILAQWYKQTLIQSVLAKNYIEQDRISGVDLMDRAETQKIFNQYVFQFENGVFDFVREEFDVVEQEIRVRNYSSGGMDIFADAVDQAMTVEAVDRLIFSNEEDYVQVEVNLEPIKDDAMMAEQEEEENKNYKDRFIRRDGSSTLPDVVKQANANLIQEVINDHHDKLTLREIADLVGISIRTLRNYIENFNLQYTHKPHAHSILSKQLITTRQKVADYFSNNPQATDPEVAKKIGIHRKTVAAHRDALGISQNKAKRSKDKYEKRKRPRSEKPEAFRKSNLLVFDDKVLPGQPVEMGQLTLQEVSLKEGLFKDDGMFAEDDGFYDSTLDSLGSEFIVRRTGKYSDEEIDHNINLVKEEQIKNPNVTTINGLAKILGVAYGTLFNFMKKYEIEHNPPKRRRGRITQEQKKQRIKDVAALLHLSNQEIAEHLDISLKTVSKYRLLAEEYLTNKESSSSSQKDQAILVNITDQKNPYKGLFIYNNVESRLLDPERLQHNATLIQEVIDDHDDTLSLREIADLVGVHQGTVLNYINKFHLRYKNKRTAKKIEQEKRKRERVFQQHNIDGEKRKEFDFIPESELILKLKDKKRRGDLVENDGFDDGIDYGIDYGFQEYFQQYFQQQEAYLGDGKFQYRRQEVIIDEIRSYLKRNKYELYRISYEELIIQLSMVLELSAEYLLGRFKNEDFFYSLIGNEYSLLLTANVRKAIDDIDDQENFYTGNDAFQFRPPEFIDQEIRELIQREFNRFIGLSYEEMMIYLGNRFDLDPEYLMNRYGSEADFRNLIGQEIYDQVEIGRIAVENLGTPHTVLKRKLSKQHSSDVYNTLIKEGRVLTKVSLNHFFENNAETLFEFHFEGILVLIADHFHFSKEILEKYIPNRKALENLLYITYVHAWKIVEFNRSSEFYMGIDLAEQLGVTPSRVSQLRKRFKIPVIPVHHQRKIDRERLIISINNILIKRRKEKGYHDFIDETPEQILEWLAKEFDEFPVYINAVMIEDGIWEKGILRMLNLAWKLRDAIASHPRMSKSQLAKRLGTHEKTVRSYIKLFKLEYDPYLGRGIQTDKQQQDYLDLIVAARKGDQKAANELFELFDKDIRLMLAKNKMRKEMDYQDIYQEVYLIFFEAMMEYDLESKENFIEFVTPRIYQKVRSHIRQVYHERFFVESLTAEQIPGGNFSLMDKLSDASSLTEAELLKRIDQQPDNALVVDPVGGINFQSLKVEQSGQEILFQLPNSNITAEGQWMGLNPIILRITPVSLPGFMGFNTTDRDQSTTQLSLN